MKKCRNFDQGTSSARLRDKETNAFTNKVNMIELEC